MRDFSDWCARHVPLCMLRWFNDYMDMLDRMSAWLWKKRNY